MLGHVIIQTVHEYYDRITQGFKVIQNKLDENIKQSESLNILSTN